MTNEEIRDRARMILAKALKTDPSRIDDNASQMDLTDWDSVRHMNVVIGLENEFEIEFEDSELANLTSLPLLVEAIKRHTSNQAAS
jgi:acyl carrier protein